MVYSLVKIDSLGEKHFNAKDGYWQTILDGNCLLTHRRAKWRKTQQLKHWRMITATIPTMEIRAYSLVLERTEL